MPGRGHGEGCCSRPTVYAPSTTLLNLGHVELEEAVEPCDEFLTARVQRWSVSVCVHGARLKTAVACPGGRGQPVLTVIHPSCSVVLEGLETGVGRWRGGFKAVASSDAA